MSNKPILYLIIFYIKIIFSLSQNTQEINNNFQKKLKEYANLSRKILVVAGAEDSTILKAVIEGHKKKLIQPILIGDEDKIKKISINQNLDISFFKIVNITDEKNICSKAIKFIIDNEAEMIMKGTVSSSYFISTIFHQRYKIMNGGILSHIKIIQIEGFNQFLLLTDSVVNLNPSLQDKIHIIKNAVKIGKILGINFPKVAILSNNNLLNENKKNMFDIKELISMSEKGIIKNCIIDGPLTLDKAISKEKYNKINNSRKIKGDANILLFPNIEIYKSVWKFINNTYKFISAQMIIGSKIPIIMIDKDNEVDSYINSMIIGSFISDYMKKY